MAAASVFFTVHIRDLAGRIIDIPDVIQHDTVAMLKDALAHELHTPRPNMNRIILTHMDCSTDTFTVLENNRTLGSYPIDYTNDILNLIINDATQGGRRRKRTTKRRLSKRHRTHRTYRK